MAFDTKPQTGTISQINVVPLVDVMLVLLVIFMVTAPILQQGEAVELPKTTSGGLPGENDQFVVTVNRDSQVFLNDEPFELETLKATLRAAMATEVGATRGVFLRADRRVEYGVVVAVMAAVREAGVTNLGMVTEPLELEGGG